MKLLIHSYTVAPLKFRNGEVTSYHTLLGMRLWMPGLKLNHVSKRDHWCPDSVRYQDISRHIWRIYFYFTGVLNGSYMCIISYLKSSDACFVFIWCYQVSCNYCCFLIGVMTGISVWIICFWSNLCCHDMLDIAVKDWIHPAKRP